MRLYRPTWAAASAALFALTSGFASTAAAQDALTSPQPPAAEQPAVEPAAREALRLMSEHLGSLRSFRVVADTSADRVYANGQALKFNTTVTYDVRRPDGFIIEQASDRHVRRLYFDGSSLTLFAPARGLFASIPAPPTIAETLDLAWEEHGISVPLEDLFRWSNPEDRRDEALLTGIHVGYALMNGEDTDHYAFQEEGLDWQIWIRRGDRPVPVRVVIVDRSDLAHPQFVADLTWTENPDYDDGAFRFEPPANAVSIGFMGGAE